MAMQPEQAAVGRILGIFGDAKRQHVITLLRQAGNDEARVTNAVSHRSGTFRSPRKRRLLSPRPYRRSLFAGGRRTFALCPSLSIFSQMLVDGFPRASGAASGASGGSGSHDGAASAASTASAASGIECGCCYDDEKPFSDLVQ